VEVIEKKRANLQADCGIDGIALQGMDGAEKSFNIIACDYDSVKTQIRD
jgi:hypothetical protein